MVKLLLGRGDISAGKSGDDGQTPLLRAASNGHAGVVKVLLGRKDVNPVRPDNDGQTPFSCAARNGHAQVIALLQPPGCSTA